MMAKRNFLRQQRVLGPICAFLAGISLTGCINPNRPITQATRPCLEDSGTVGDFVVEVTDVRSTDRIMRPGMESIPEAQRTMLGEQMYVRPQASFLVLDLQVTNTSKQPLLWSGYLDRFMVYNLISSEGVVYEFSPQLSSIVAGSVGGNINPGMSALGTVVFDVPKARYNFIIAQQRLTGVGAISRFFSQSEVLRCSLPV
jgi:hypothetical protein